MGNSNSRIIKISAVAALLLSLFISVNFCYATGLEPKGINEAFKIDKDNSPLKSAAGPGGSGFKLDVTFEEITGTIITSVLSIIGVLFLILAIYGGYTWMTARGNEEAVEKAKNTLTNAIIGIVIVLASYAISYFVLSQISPKVLK